MSFVTDAWRGVLASNAPGWMMSPSATATCAPVGRTKDKNLPVGLQILGPYLEDATPIDIAGKLADLIGGFTPPPGYAG